MNSLSADYPTFMMTKAFASLIPKNETYTPVLKHAFLLHTFEFFEVINRNKIIKIAEKREKIIDELERSLEILVSIDFLPDDFRVSVLKKWKLVVEDNGSTGVSDAVRSAAKVWLTRYKLVSG